MNRITRAACLNLVSLSLAAAPSRKANQAFLLMVLPLNLAAAMLEEANFMDWRPRHIQNLP